MPSELPRGQWGGEHVSLMVTAASASLEFDCAHGTIDEPLVVDSEGRFNLNGAYVRERGGPIRDGEPEDRSAALYSGRLEGTRLTLSIQLKGEETQIGPFAAFLGQPSRLLKCL